MNAGEARIYCEAGPGIGLGHVARCIAVAEALREDGLEPVFVTGAAGQEALRWMAPGCFRAVPPADAAVGACAIAVFDDYSAGPERIATIAREAGRTVVLDDLGGRALAVDLVVNAAPDADAGLYASQPAGSARLLLGPGYAPIRAAVRRRRGSVLADRERCADAVGTILATAGGLDGRGLAPVFVQAILDASQAQGCWIAVALGGQATSWPAVEALVAMAPERIRCLRNVPDMAELFGLADFSVGPGGVTLLEKLCLGLPSLAVIVADNQASSVAGLAALGCVAPLDARGKGRDEIRDAVRQEIDAALAASDSRRAMGRRGAALVDGLGARRIALAALPERDRVGRAVTLRPMREQDTEMVFGWQHEPGMRRYFRDPEPPDPTGHRRWCAARLADPFGLCEIVLADGKPAGLVRLDGAGASEADDEVSLLVVGAEQGKGIGTAALRALRRLSRETAMWAHIHPENRASQGSFRRAGFTLASSDRAVAAALATDQG